MACAVALVALVQSNDGPAEFAITARNTGDMLALPAGAVAKLDGGTSVSGSLLGAGAIGGALLDSGDGVGWSTIVWAGGDGAVAVEVPGRDCGAPSANVVVDGDGRAAVD